MKFIAIKDINEYEKMIVDIFKQLSGNSVTNKVRDGFIFIYLDYENNEELENVLNAFEANILTNIYAYISYDRDLNKLTKEEDLVIELLKEIKPGVYNLKSALLENPRLTNQGDILDFILENTGISEHFIKGFVESNLNVSQAAKNMFIHRNTMIYKLDKLKAVSGFDLRDFKDAFVLYLLINDKQ